MSLSIWAGWLLMVVLLVPVNVVWAQVVNTPTVPQPNGSQLIGANFQNPTGGTVAAGPVQFGQALVAGDLTGGSGISATVNGANAPAQIDVKTAHPDGSVKFGVITVMAPSLLSYSTNPTLISPAAANGGTISLSSLPGYNFVVTIVVTGSSTYIFNIPSLFAQELTAGRISYWRQGPIVTEGRISVPIVSSMRLVVDLARYEDGSYTTDLQVNNDHAMTAVGGQVDYSVTVVQNSVTVAAYPNLQHQQYQQWRQLFSTAAARPVNVQRDVAYLVDTGVIHNYDLSVGVANTYISRMQTALARTGWGKPFDTADITRYMPGTGGRDDIGQVPNWNAAWIKSQHATAASYALGQAQAAAGIPWHFWDAGNNTWLNTNNYPNVWTDGRGGTGTPGNSSSPGLTQQIAASLYDWYTDSAHQPALAFIPYVFTGVRFYLDQLNASGSFVEMSFWPSGPELGNARNYGEGLVLSEGNQVRGSAWSFRELATAAWANPDGTVEKSYFTLMVNNNLNHVNGLRAARTTEQGETQGYQKGVYGNGEAMAPWQQDYLMQSIAYAAQLGFSAADTYIHWLANWSTGRFRNGANGFNPRDGVNYNLIVKPSGQPLAATWGKLGEYNASRTNGNGWAESDGDYGQLGLAALATLINRTGVQSARDAYATLLALAPPYTTLADYQTGPTFNIVPRVSIPATTTPPVTPTATLTANATQVGAGQSLTLTWSSANATTCTGTNFTAGATSGTRVVSPASTTTYSVSCAGAGGTVAAQRTVGVTPAVVTPTTPTATLTANATQVGAGQSLTLTWSSTNATTCTGTNFTAGATSGTRTVALSITTTYTVRCTGSGGAAAADRTVGVTPVTPTPSRSGGGGGGSGGRRSTPTSTLRTPTSGTSTKSNGVLRGGTKDTLASKFGTWQFSAAQDTGGYELLLKNKPVRSNGARYLLTAGSNTVYAVSKTNVVSSWRNRKFRPVSASTAARILALIKNQPTTPNVPTTGSSTANAIGSGSRVRTTSNVNVRQTAGVNGFLRGRQPLGMTGTITGGPVIATGYTWWQVDFDSNAIDGWAAASYLTASAGVRTPLVLGDMTDRLITTLGVTPLQKYANSYLFTEPLAVGASGVDVVRLQNALVGLGHLAPKATTGYYGRYTQQAVRALQQEYNLPLNGVVNEAELDVLNWR